MAKVIKDKESYKKVLTEISVLLDNDPVPGSTQAEHLELLTLLVQDYESKNFPLSAPNPIDAIKFRMQQKDLSQSDLAPLFGGRSKVSEVLSGKRPLSLSMIRALHSNLGIPAEILLQESDSNFNNKQKIEWERFPLKEMISRGWISANLTDAKNRAEDLLKNFFAPIGNPTEVTALYLQTNSVRSARSMDKYALAAWTAQVLNSGLKENLGVKYQPNIVDIKFMQEVAKLSWFENGPILAKEFLAKHGIALIIEPHLQQTYLDGAAIMVKADRPVIGLSLRHDRLDNFWFALMHELAHIALHYGQGITHFYDDLDINESENPKEKEADQLASEALIPENEWRKSPASVLKSPQSVEQLSKKLRISPAIVAGRIRREYKSYHILNNLVGHGKVRNLFDQSAGGTQVNV